jgi:hypothetical protein
MRKPPRFVPTLTEVVQAPPEPPRQAGPPPPPAPAPAQPPEPVPAVHALLSEEQLVHRVMQRVDISLDRRLREAVAAVVLEQTRLLGPLLRDEVEAVVRAAITEALADELSALRQPGAPRR